MGNGYKTEPNRTYEDSMETDYNDKITWQYNSSNASIRIENEE